MNDPEETGPVLFAERGASWWPLLWGPVFAVVALGLEVATPGPAHPVAWLLAGGALLAATALWVYGRRRVCSVRLTPSTLTLGREPLRVARIVAVSGKGAPTGARVLGGGWMAPNGTAVVPLLLDDDRVVLAWARTRRAWPRRCACSSDPESWLPAPGRTAPAAALEGMRR